MVHLILQDAHGFPGRTVKFNSIFSFVCFIRRFPSLLPFDSAVELEELSQEFNDYLLLDESELNLGCKDK